MNMRTVFEHKEGRKKVARNRLLGLVLFSLHAGRHAGRQQCQLLKLSNPWCPRRFAELAGWTDAEMPDCLCRRLMDLTISSPAAHILTAV
jgi:hypothetical protein